MPNSKRLIIICEGQTEQEFCRDVLQPFFVARQVYIHLPTIKKSNGGIVAWEHLKKQVEVHLKQDPTARVTLLIDYYGMYSKHDFPSWNHSLTIVDRSLRMEAIENAMKSDIDGNLRNRFIPYIQLHEFEGLLFNNIAVFDQNIPPNELSDRDELNRIIHSNPNPELINNGSTTAPSKRLERLIKGYNKVVYGAILAEAIGLASIRAKCPRFNRWITTLENI